MMAPRRIWLPIMLLLEAMCACTGVVAFVALVTGDLAWFAVFGFASVISLEAAYRIGES